MIVKFEQHTDIDGSRPRRMGGDSGSQHLAAVGFPRLSRSRVWARSPRAVASAGKRAPKAARARSSMSTRMT